MLFLQQLELKKPEPKKASSSSPCMTLDVDKSDLDRQWKSTRIQFFQPFVMILPHRAVGDCDLEVFFLNPQKVIIKVTIPHYLTQPDHFTPVRKTQNKEVW